MSKKNEETKESVEEPVEQEKKAGNNQDKDEMAGVEEAGGDLVTKIVELEGQVKEYEDLVKRKVADFDNFRKRTIAEREQMKQMMGDKVITDFLIVLDNLDRALDAGKKSRDFDALIDGVESIRHIFMSTLTQYGVEMVDSIGKDFDPRIHQALHMVEGDYEKQTVIEEVERAFVRNDKVLRTGKVAVGMPKKKKETEKKEAEEK